MKYFLIGVLLITLASSCQKVHHTGDTTPTTQSFEPTKQYDIRFKADNQKVVINNYTDPTSGKILDSVLALTYNENVALIVRDEDYDQSWGIRFEESFKGTGLDGMLYTTFNKDGVQVFNYLESNLNNITLQSKSDTLINGNTYLNLKVNRVLTFYQYYTAGKAAADQARINLLNTKSDVVTHTAYFTYNNQNSVPVSGTTPILYTKP